jgi:hypothetical protein
MSQTDLNCGQQHKNSAAGTMHAIDQDYDSIPDSKDYPMNDDELYEDSISEGDDGYTLDIERDKQGLPLSFA